ncbi:MAG TPA: TRAP transporter small permease subunit [Burkholderiales bacterium]|nr:TRAP transporter small permease subunit [Burkholderiales bacterium]
MKSVLFMIDRLSTWTGKAFAWCGVLLTLIVCYDVAARYIFRNPTQWGFDVAIILYGVLFMMAGAYTLSRNGHVRADMMYRTLRPRSQAWIDLALYLLFFFPGIAALVYAGVEFAHTSWAMREVSSVTSAGTPIYPFKMAIPLAGLLLFLQGVAEVVRCVICIRTDQWPQRLHDVEEEDIEQLKDILAGGQEKK